MEGLELFDKLLNERIMLGKEIKLKDDLSIIPVYKLKVNTMNINAEVKTKVGDGSGGGFTISPVCILKILDTDISVVRLDDKQSKEDFFDFIPSLLTNINVNDLIKNLKN